MRSLALLISGLLVAGTAAAVVIVPPVTTKCFSQFDDLLHDGGATVCVDWGRNGCAAWVTHEHHWGAGTICLASWPEVLP